MRLLDKFSRDQNIHSATIPISMRIPSADLPPGAYTLELRIKLAEGGDEVVRSVDFEVQ